MEQMRMPVSDKKPHRVDDFYGCFPQGVMPTGNIYMLECRGSVLLIKSYNQGQEITNAQRRMFKQAVATTSEEHPVTIFCVWGLGPIARRDLVVFNHMGESSKKLMTQSEFQHLLRIWWSDNDHR